MIITLTDEALPMKVPLWPRKAGTQAAAGPKITRTTLLERGVSRKSL